MKRWIQKVIWHPGTLHKELEISKSKKIPSKLINKIVSAEIGKIITNPTTTGKKKIKVTRLLKRRVSLLRNLENIHNKK